MAGPRLFLVAICVALRGSQGLTASATTSTSSNGVRGGTTGVEGVERELALQRIVGYQPRTQVTDHAALDLDQAAMEEELFLGKLLKARNVYQEGGHSKSFAQLTLLAPQGPAAFAAGTDVYGKTPEDGEVFGKLRQDSVWGVDNAHNITVEVEYETSDVQGRHVSCQVGGLYTFYEANKYGCFNGSGRLTVFQHPENQLQGGIVFDYEYDIRLDNMNARTLQALSTNANWTMKQGGEDCEICPYIDDFQLYYDYYGDTDYANKFWHAASYNKSTTFKSGRGKAVFSEFRFKAALAEAMAKSTVVLHVWMYVIRQMEDAISLCRKGADCTGVDNCGDDPMHALDEAVAFYAGSLEGEDGSGDGKFLYDLADRMAVNFKTAGEFGAEEDGTAFVNWNVIREFKKAQLYVLQNECDKAVMPKEYIVNNMKVPLVQGLLKATYTRQFENPVSRENSEQLEAEGATYMAALLPYVHACNVEDARTLHHNMHIGSSASKVSFADVKKALEGNYECLGIECKDVGGIWTVNGYATGAEPCGGVGSATSNSNASSDPTKKAGVVAGITVGLVAGLLLIFLLVRTRRRKRKDRSVQRRSGNIAAVSEIS